MKISASWSSVFAWSMEMVTLQHMITKKMMTNLDVLCLRVLNWVMSNLDSALIVAVERHILHVDAIVLECLLHP